MRSVSSRVVELVETFDRNVQAYRSQQYKEAQLRREFIDPFFEELSWDVTKMQQNSPVLQRFQTNIFEFSIKFETNKSTNSFTTSTA